MVHEVRKSIPGRDANLPPFIIERMEELGYRPTASQLALLCGTGHVSMQRYLRGEREMPLSTAAKMRTALKLESIDKLIDALPYLAE